VPLPVWGEGLWCCVRYGDGGCFGSMGAGAGECIHVLYVPCAEGLRSVPGVDCLLDSRFEIEGLGMVAVLSWGDFAGLCA
jgi:hypothetical protein